MSNIVFICKICGKEYKGMNPVGKHLKDKHNMNVKEYYDKYLKKPHEGECLNCGKPTFFHRSTDGYLKYCSNTCQMEYQVKTNYNGVLDRKKENENKELEIHNKCINYKSI